MTLYGGIDLHSNNVLISLIDDQEKVISEKRLPNELPIIQQHLSPDLPLVLYTTDPVLIL